MVWKVHSFPQWLHRIWLSHSLLIASYCVWKILDDRKEVYYWRLVLSPQLYRSTLLVYITYITFISNVVRCAIHNNIWKPNSYWNIFMFIKINHIGLHLDSLILNDNTYFELLSTQLNLVSTCAYLHIYIIVALSGIN